MMRAWAAISAAAVLVALPVSVQQASGEQLESGTTGAAGVSGTPAGPAASVADIGVVLWLSVAVVASLAAFLVLRHSRRMIALDGSGALNTVSPVGAVGTVGSSVAPAAEPLSFVRPDRSGATSTATGR